jgi:hypothetical protein
LLLLSSHGVAGETPVPLPCKPEDCPPVDPCKIAPERCKDKGGPIGASEASNEETE